jgi:hypothetical protein
VDSRLGMQGLSFFDVLNGLVVRGKILTLLMGVFRRLRAGGQTRKRYWELKNPSKRLSMGFLQFMRHGAVFGSMIIVAMFDCALFD